jgi:hypothetical protein
VRTLAGSQRLTDALAQATALTQSEPTLAPAWLTLGALELEMKHPKEATVALQTYVRLVEGGAAVAPARRPAALPDDDGDDDDADDGRRRAHAGVAAARAGGRAAARLRRGGALARQDRQPAARARGQSRRASLLAKQGKMAEARQLIRRLPEQTTADARAKYVAEAELLRDAKQWARPTRSSPRRTSSSRTTPTCSTSRAMVVEKLDRWTRWSGCCAG